MTLRQKICDSGNSTLRELICSPLTGGADVYVDSYSANIIDEVLTANLVDTYQANIIEEVLTANLIEDKHSANIEEETLTGDLTC